MNIYGDIRAAQQRHDQQRENEARQGTEMLRQRTTGSGQLILPVAHVFANPFTHKPHVSYGSEIVRAPASEWSLPRCTGTVLRWETNSRGFYTAAFLYVVVDISLATGEAEPDDPPSCVTEHCFSFTGMSYKSFGPAVQQGVEDVALATRPTNF